MKKYIGLITGLLPLLTSAQLVMTGPYYMVMAGGTQSNPTSLVLTNSSTSGITTSGTSWIVSENEFNQVDWNIGTNTGAYVVPFGYSNTAYMPLTFNVGTAGTGNGVVKFATYHGSSWDNASYKPSDVTSMGDYGAADYSVNMIDRFWIVDANTGYSTKPGASLIFTYINSGGSSESATPNYIVNAALIAQRFNSSSSKWDDFTGNLHSYGASGNTATVSSGPVTAADLYRSWTVANDSSLILGVPQVTGGTSAISIYPNPTLGNISISGLERGQVIEMYDYLGQLLSRAVADNRATMQLNISTQANGVYLLRIENSDGSLLAVKKIVKTQ